MGAQPPDSDAPIALADDPQPAAPVAPWQRYGLVAVGGLLIALVLLFPGDIPWHNDEPWLIKNALEHNDLGKPALLGLRGSVGVRYGPVPTWIYQGLLMLTHDPIALGLIKTVASIAILMVTLWRLATILRLPRFFALFILASPYVHHYIRILWDNSFTVVLSPLFLLTALEALRRRSVAWMAATMGVAWLLIHSHLNNALLIVPVFAVLLWAERRSWRKRLPAVLAVLVVGALATAPYARYAVTEVALAAGFRGSVLDAVAAWLSGARYLAAMGWREHFFHELIGPATPVPAAAVMLLEAITWLAFAFCAYGLVDTVRHWLDLRRRRDPWEYDDWFALTALGVILALGVYFIGSRQVFAPHYLVGGWMCYGYFAWRGMQQALRHWPRPAAIAIAMHLAALVAFLVLSKAVIHTNGGNRGGINGTVRSDNYGATLANQLDVAHTILQHHPDSTQIIQVDNFTFFQDDLPTLLALKRQAWQPADPQSLPRRTLLIRYRDYDPTYTGWIIVEPLDD